MFSYLLNKLLDDSNFHKTNLGDLYKFLGQIGWTSIKTLKVW